MVIICLFTKIIGCVCQVTHDRQMILYSSTYYHSSPHSR